MAKRMGLKPFLAQFVGIAPQPGREYIVIGPMCWGRGQSVKEAHDNAHKNRARIYERAGWQFIVYNVPTGTTVSEIDGGLNYPADKQPPQELARFNMHETKK